MNNFKMFRKQHNLTQAQIAKFLDCSTQAYQRYEKGEREPDYSTLHKLADYFETSIDYLLGRTNDPQWTDKEKNKRLPSDEVAILKARARELGITYPVLAERSGVPIQTLQKIFCGLTQHPRIDTMQAIECALGLKPETQDREATTATLSTRELNALAIINRAEEVFGREHIDGMLKMLEMNTEQKIKEKK